MSVKLVPPHDWLVGYVHLVSKDQPGDWVCAVINDLLETRRELAQVKHERDTALTDQRLWNEWKSRHPHFSK